MGSPQRSRLILPNTNRLILPNTNRFRGLLDLFPGARFAMSTRLLKYDLYNSWIMQVRRNSDNDAVLAKPDLSLAVPVISLNSLLVSGAGTLGQFVGNGSGFVVASRNQTLSGVGDAVQVGITKQPRIIIDGAMVVNINGKPAIDFNLNKGLIVSNYLDNIAFSASVIVSKTSTWAAYHTVVDGNAADRRTRSGGIVDAGTTTMHLNVYPINSWRSGVNKGFAGSLAPIDTPFQLSLQHSGVYAPTLTIGNYDNGSVGGSAIQSETIVFPSVLSTQDRQTLERNQGTFYGITVA
jgi:hypothetical protein